MRLYFVKYSLRRAYKLQTYKCSTFFKIFLTACSRFPTPVGLADFLDVVSGYKDEDYNFLRDEFKVR